MHAQPPTLTAKICFGTTTNTSDNTEDLRDHKRKLPNSLTH